MCGGNTEQTKECGVERTTHLDYMALRTFVHSRLNVTTAVNSKEVFVREHPE
jgi:hypothetical protein